MVAALPLLNPSVVSFRAQSSSQRFLNFVYLPCSSNSSGNSAHPSLLHWALRAALRLLQVDEHLLPLRNFLALAVSWAPALRMRSVPSSLPAVASPRTRRRLVRLVPPASIPQNRSIIVLVRSIDPLRRGRSLVRFRRRFFPRSKLESLQRLDHVLPPFFGLWFICSHHVQLLLVDSHLCDFRDHLFFLQFLEALWFSSASPPRFHLPHSCWTLLLASTSRRFIRGPLDVRRVCLPPLVRPGPLLDVVGLACSRCCSRQIPAPASPRPSALSFPCAF